MSSKGSRQAHDSLCTICRTLPQITQDFAVVDYGSKATLQSETTCCVCQLVLGLLPDARTPESRLAPIKLRKMGRDAFLVWQGAHLLGEVAYFYAHDKDLVHPVLDLPLSEICSTKTHVIDYGRISLWMNECAAHHDTCADLTTLHTSRNLPQTYLIDTVENCLVKATTGYRYIALSYVRGDATMFETTIANVSMLQRSGALLECAPYLNELVRNALEFARHLKERYIWIDSLCIPQDDRSLKAEMIMNMNQIYSHAFLTIIALSTTTADSSLPGFGPAPRLQSTRRMDFDDPSAESGLPNSYISCRPSLSDILTNSTYSTRGWTFQECILSRRCVIFTDHQIFLQCNSSLTTECGFVGNSDVWPLRTLLSANVDRREDDSDSVYDFSTYSQLVQDFSKRKLSFPHDSINAVSGILNVFSNRLGWQFHAGLPSHLLHYALLWRTASSDPARNRYFPSWSWAGWDGQASWQFQNLQDPLWDAKDNEPLAALQPEVTITTDLDSVDRPGWSSWADAQNGILRIRADSVDATAFRIRNGRPSVNTDPDSAESHIHLSPYREIWTVEGTRCGILYDFLGKLNGTKRFTALSRFKWDAQSHVSTGQVYGETFVSWYAHICDNQVLEFSEYCLMNVMLIEVQEGQAERLGIGWIHVDAWQSLSPKNELLELR